MAPGPQEFEATDQGEKAALGVKRVVISGFSGLYPQSQSVKDLSNILYNKINPITENQRWQCNQLDRSRYLGEVPDLNLFDSQFFKVPYRLTNIIDPMSRKLLEQTFHAIYDAGLSPEYFAGKRVAVYVTNCFSESEKTCFFDTSSKTNLGILGCSKTMFANRISYWLNTKGPSMAIDEESCSSIAALEQAYLAISSGDCEAAIVGGSNLCMHPQYMMQYGHIVPLSTVGKTRSFNEDADGTVCSEAINILVLQKPEDALRIYAEILHVKTEFISLSNTEMGPRCGLYRNSNTMAEFIKQFYKEAGVSPQAVEYVEAVGCGEPDSDKAELEAIDEVYCNNRTEPLLVGSVISNIGYTAAASGISAITKVLLGYQNGSLAGNLHCESPRQDVSALREGRLRVLTDHQQFRRTYTAVNGISVTGVNAHVLLHGRYKPKDPSRYVSNIPHLVTISGRQESSVNKIIEDLKSRPVDPEELALLHNIHEKRIGAHLARGFVILGMDMEQKTSSLCEKADYYDDVQRPLWFVYSGMGSQWAGMGAQLMRIPIFAAAIERCRKVLEPKGVDIVHIITSPDKTIFNNILNSFVGIAAIQIGLTDILHELDLKPDKIIGHSVGELGCAYADGCLTAEEMVLSAYSRGLVSLQTPLIRGSMAAVGLGYHQISKLCPPEIDVACHNGSESSTISGPADVMRNFVADLTAKGIFAKEVPCSNIAYHSRYIATAGPSLATYLKEVIKSPKPRSERWLSTSVPQQKWNEPAARLCSAEYHTNNLLNPVLFEETSRLVPNNAVLVEVAPHGLLQAILKRSLPASCCNIALTRRGHADNALLLLQAIGELYMQGYNPKIRILYPKVEFPVSTETPSLSHLVEWAHVESWALARYVNPERKNAAACRFIYSYHDDEHSYLKGNVIRDMDDSDLKNTAEDVHIQKSLLKLFPRPVIELLVNGVHIKDRKVASFGKTLFPIAGVLVAVWDTVAMASGATKKQMSVRFDDVRIHAQPELHDQRTLRLMVTLHKGTGRFEVMNEKSKVATGLVYIFIQSATKHSERRKIFSNESNNLILTSTDIYHLLSERDYNYNGEFRSIHSANASLTEAQLVWHNNWVTLIDGMLQLNALRQTHDNVSQPVYIRRMCIDTQNSIGSEIIFDGKAVIETNINELEQLTTCAGVSIEHIKYRHLPHKHKNTFKILASNIPRIQTLQDNQKILSEEHEVSLQIAEHGDLNSLHWVEIPKPLGSGIKVRVHYAGLNNSDVKRATRIIPFMHENDLNTGSYYGMDFSGTTESGERVMGIVGGGACSSRVRAQPELLWPVPAHWSLEDAATVPLAYAHAFYCLGLKSEPCRGMNILVHGGAGALGQAAISIALAFGCEVFTTVSDVNKKRFLLKLFPDLKEHHIGNSREQSFRDMVKSATSSRGCDIIICCTKNALKDSLRNCCAPFGVTLNTFQITNQESYSFGMEYLWSGKTYVTTDFSSILHNQNFQEMQALQVLVSEGIARGYVRPLSRVTYAPHEAPRAFRLLAASQHRGRVLLRLHDSLPPAQPRLFCDPDNCHVLLCNEEAFALQFADRLVTNGARKLYIHYESPPAYVQYKLRSWQKLGVQVKLSSVDLTETKYVTNLVKDVIRLGPIEGIYVIATGAQDKNAQGITALTTELDLASRQFCPVLKYFGVFNIDNNIGRQICIARAQDLLPGTMLNLPIIKNINNDDSMRGRTAGYRQAIEAMELALRSTHPVLVAQPLQSEPSSLLQELAVVANINLPEKVPENMTLGDLGVDDAKAQVISALLRDNHNVCFEASAVPLLSIQNIRDLQERDVAFAFEDVKGLQQFFSYVDPDELLATTEAVFLPTLANSAALRDDEIDVSETYLCIVPGLEGHHERFRALCERLKLPALVLQPGLDNLNETIEETAKRYVEILLKKIELNKNFYLLGYESGVLVALEIAAILEKSGLTGTVFLVGYAPEEFQIALEQELIEYKTEEQLKDAILRHMFCTLMSKDKSTELETVMRGTSTWQQKLNDCARRVLGRVSHSTQYVCALIESAFARIEQVRRYNAAPTPLRSRLVLLRAASSDTLRTKSAPTSALQAHSSQPVTVCDLTAPLPQTTNDMRCAAIINRYISTELLEEFENKNVCESYLIDGEKFISN